MKNTWAQVRSIAIRWQQGLAQAHRAEGGQVIILFVPMLILFAVAGWMVVDVGTAFAERRHIQHTVDIMALAGAQELPGDPAAARAAATAWAARNGITAPLYTIDVTTDNTCYNTDPLDDPSKMDTIAIRVVRPADRYFANVFATGPMTVGASAKACWGGPSVPLDVVVVIDRSSSMTPSDLQNAKDAANAILALYDPNEQHLALGVLGGSSTSSMCTNGGVGKPHASLGGGTWTPVGLSSNYKTAGGALNSASQLVKTISCLETSGVGTNLTTPMAAAQALLTTTGRPGVKKGIIFMTDGAANQVGNTPTNTANTNPCNAANTAATAAKAAGIEIFVVGFGVEAEVCRSTTGENGSSVYNNQVVTKLLADMATDSADDHNSCQSAADVDAENADGDHFLCAPKTSDLTTVFEQAAKSLAGIVLVE